MRFHEIKPATVRSAVDIYLSEAYPGGIPPRIKLPEAVASGKTTDEVLAGFKKDNSNKAPDANVCLQRWVLQLGNDRYPFMKLVLHEYLIEGEYVFAVDTHDDMGIQPHFPDYEEWQKLKKLNIELRERIESRWKEEKLDTCSRLREKMHKLAPRRGGCGSGKRALVVDDEADLAGAFADLLRSEGFQVETACNGREAFEMIKAKHPDLVLTDCEMPVMDGLQLIQRMKDDPETRAIPVLLASASQLSLMDMARATVFLAKPFSAETLLAYCEPMMHSSKTEAPRRTGADTDTSEL